MQVLISLRRKKTYVEVVLVEFNIVVVIDQETRVHRIIDDIIVIFKFLKQISRIILTYLVVVDFLRFEAEKKDGKY